MQHCASVRASTRVYIKCMSVQVGYVLEKWGQTRFFFFLFAFDLNPTAWRAGRRRLRGRADSLPPLGSFYLQSSRLSASGRQELWSVNSTFNNTLMAGRGSILVPKRVQTEVKVDGSCALDGSHYFWGKSSLVLPHDWFQIFELLITGL